MKVLIAALAVSVLAIAHAPAQIQLRIVADSAQSGTRSETTGGDVRNPEPHIYRLGEHLSEAYGSYELIDDWQRARLTAPPGGHHWVRYGENYLLVTATDGLITRIVRAPA